MGHRLFAFPVIRLADRLHPTDAARKSVSCRGVSPATKRNVEPPAGTQRPTGRLGTISIHGPARFVPPATSLEPGSPPYLPERFDLMFTRLRFIARGYLLRARHLLRTGTWPRGPHVIGSALLGSTPFGGAR